MQCECQTRDHSETCIFGKRDRAVDIAIKYINDDSKSKQWVLEKIIKILSGKKYQETISKTNYSKLDSAIEDTLIEISSMSDEQFNKEIIDLMKDDRTIALQYGIDYNMKDGEI